MAEVVEVSLSGGGGWWLQGTGEEPCAAWLAALDRAIALSEVRRADAGSHVRHSQEHGVRSMRWVETLGS